MGGRKTLMISEHKTTLSESSSKRVGLTTNLEHRISIKDPAWSNLRRVFLRP